MEDAKVFKALLQEQYYNSLSANDSEYISEFKKDVDAYYTNRISAERKSHHHNNANDYLNRSGYEHDKEFVDKLRNKGSLAATNKDDTVHNMNTYKGRNNIASTLDFDFDDPYGNKPRKVNSNDRKRAYKAAGRAKAEARKQAELKAQAEKEAKKSTSKVVLKPKTTESSGNKPKTTTSSTSSTKPKTVKATTGTSNSSKSTTTTTSKPRTKTVTRRIIRSNQNIDSEVNKVANTKSASESEKSKAVEQMKNAVKSSSNKSDSDKIKKIMAAVAIGAITAGAAAIAIKKIKAARAKKKAEKEKKATNESIEMTYINSEGLEKSIALSFNEFAAIMEYKSDDEDLFIMNEAEYNAIIESRELL